MENIKLLMKKTKKNFFNINSKKNQKKQNILQNLLKKIIIYTTFFCPILFILLFVFKFIFKYKKIEENIEYINIEKMKLFESQDYKNIKNYVDDCYNLKLYNRKITKEKIPFVSICLAAHNVGKYLESTLLSILNQSFQNFEIVIVNDFSNDNTLEILEKYKMNAKIKVINHLKNLGAYASRVDGVRNSNGKFAITMDADDMLLEPELLSNLYYYNILNNLDITEFRFLHYEEKEKSLKKENNYFHDYKKNIVYQPELCNLFFYVPGTKIYSDVISRVVWNKLIRKELLLKSYDYIGEDFYNELIITTEDTLVNLIILQFANNYTFANYFGYMYNLREKSATHNKEIKHTILFAYNYLLYLKKLYSFIKDYNKDRNFLFYEFKANRGHIINLYSLDISKREEINNFHEDILKDNYISNEFRYFIKNYIK